VKTLSGATISVASLVLIVILVLSEFSLYWAGVEETQLAVDHLRNEKFSVAFDIEFPNMPCSIISLDAMDVAGEVQSDIQHAIIKHRLDENGKPKDAMVENDLGGRGAAASLQAEKEKLESGASGSSGSEECGSCYGAETEELKCCNTCDDVREAYGKKGWAFHLSPGITQCTKDGILDRIKDEVNEGCRITGGLNVNKVAGNFHFAPGHAFQSSHAHLHDMLPQEALNFNLTHTIHFLTFGEKIHSKNVHYPLDGTSKTFTGPSMFQYFIKIVPAMTEKRRGGNVQTNLFSVTEYTKKLDMGNMRGAPGVFFFYDFSPVMVVHKEHGQSFIHFLTGVCAIVGGIFTVAGMLDSAVYKGKQIANKMRLGKQS